MTVDSRARPGAGAVAVLLAVALAAAGLVVVYLAHGGGSYKPLTVADPCRPRHLRPAQGLDAVSQQLALSALDGAACRLRVRREDLALALATPRSRARFVREHHISNAALGNAIRAGLRRAVTDARRSGRLSSGEAALLDAGVAQVPIETLIDAVRSNEGLLRGLGGFLGG